MDAGSLLIILAVTVIVGAFIARPFFVVEKKSRVPLVNNPVEHQYSALLAEKERLAQALQELDFDNALGKIPQEDYPLMRAALLKQAAEVLQALEKLEQEISLHGVSVEKEVPGSVQVEQSSDDIEELIRLRRKQRQERSSGFCSKCGNPVQKSDRFCPRCGNALVVLGEEK
ncbi:zinc ribbon domain-containing protein [Anaerolinea sp.]|uniref:zinc ribbon domain-containing protein n=1 Tax=Anaerolinea sp. TaxID=1872519 RepID=UPI002ACE8A30|nr:zinc ribbon domain-containing protein [Anaerolinea sp.]